MTPGYQVAPSPVAALPSWVDGRWPRWPDGSPLRCPVCDSYNLDDADCELEDQSMWPHEYNPSVLCNDCQSGGRDPFVIERANGVYVAVHGGHDADR